MFYSMKMEIGSQIKRILINNGVNKIKKVITNFINFLYLYIKIKKNKLFSYDKIDCFIKKIALKEEKNVPN